MIDASDKQLLDWIASLPPRYELVVRMAIRYQAKNLGPAWAPRIDALMGSTENQQRGQDGS